MPEEFGSNIIFVWEFNHDNVNKRILNVKYYALDEILGFIGGNLSIVITIAAVFMNPFSLIDFVIDNSSKKEEIKLQINQSIHDE